jgi:hypothetical protein
MSTLLEVCEQLTCGRWAPYLQHVSSTKVAVVRDSHKLFLSLTGEFEWKFSRLPFIYCFFSLKPFIQIEVDQLTCSKCATYLKCASSLLAVDDQLTCCMRAVHVVDEQFTCRKRAVLAVEEQLICSRWAAYLQYLSSTCSRRAAYLE